MANADFFAQVEQLDTDVQDGKISGIVTWPLEGHAELKDVRADYKDGKQYFFIKLIGDKGTREFAIKIPAPADKDAAKFMAMQKIYGTIFAVGGVVPGKTGVGEAFKAAHDAIGATVAYRLEEYTSFSEKHGKEFTNQALAGLAIVEAGEFQ
jgi:hypothetical protein